MVAIRTVLCPVDLSAASERQVEAAARLCRLYGARLVLHHNVEALPVGAAVGWMRAGAQGGPETEDATEARLQALLESAAPGVDREARITHGLPSQTVMAVGDLVGADLVVLATHDAPPEERTSVSEQLLEHSERTLFVLHERDVADGRPSLLATGDEPRPVLVPTDLAGGSRAAEELAFDLAGRLPLELHLLHVAEPGRKGEPGADLVEDAMRARIPETLRGRVELHLGEGDPATAIEAAAKRLGAVGIVMGEHTKSFLRRWFTPDVSRALLHQAPCPVWYVPAGLAG